MATVQNIIDAAVEWAVGIANNNKHGYSQAQRSLYNFDGTSYDCSSLVCTAFEYAFEKYGITPTPKSCGCTYTGNMLNLQKCGFEIVATNQTGHASMQKGDIELNVTHHTALAIDNNNIVHARTSEGTSNTTDDSGNEIRTQGWYVYSKGWTHRLRFTGNGMNLESTTDVEIKTQEVKEATVVNTTGYTKTQFIRDVQSITGADVDGIAGPNTLAHTVTISKTKNSRHAVVKFVQKWLIAQGYSCGSCGADGDFGSATEIAMKNFQSDHGCTVDGEATAKCKTWKCLLGLA